MSKSIDISTLKIEHDFLYPKSQALCLELIRQIEHLIEKENIQLAVPLQYRAKSFSSIYDKIVQGRFNIKKSLLELQDLAGVRIITLFKRDSIKVANLINSTFAVSKQYNTEEKLDDNEFGYSSIHLVCKVNRSWLDLPSFSDFGEIKFEIQIRTLSQHSWAEASNIFQYKNDENVPKPLKRSISRISALLETVDLEFERLLTERATYKAEAKEQMNEKIKNDILNVDLLEEFLSKQLPQNHRRSEEDYSILIDNLNVLGYNSIEAVNDLITKHLKDIMQENDRVCDGFKNLYKETKIMRQFESYVCKDDISAQRILNGIFFSHGGLIRGMLTKDLGRPWNIVYEEKKKILQ